MLGDGDLWSVSWEEETDFFGFWNGCGGVRGCLVGIFLEHCCAVLHMHGILLRWPPTAVSLPKDQVLAKETPAVVGDDAPAQLFLGFVLGLSF